MPIQNEVFLRKEDHRYFGVSDNREYTSLSHVLKSYDNGPDWGLIAGNVAGKGKFKDYPTKEAVLAFWKANGKEAMDFGSEWHEEIEGYIKGFKLPADEKKHEVIKEIAFGYKDFYRVECEQVLYHPEYGVAGTADVIAIPKKGGDKFFVPDYKTALKTGGIDYFNKDGIFMLEPVSHLQSCKFVKYALQVSCYGFMMERLTGMKCQGGWISFINDYKVQRIWVPYMKNEAQAILKHFHDKRSVSEAVVLTGVDENSEAPTFIE